MTSREDGAVRTIKLFCFPHGGGGTADYRGWPLGPGIETVPVALPGREARIAEPPPTDMAALADQLAAELAPELTGPYAFFGHSMGAAVAWEVAHRTDPLAVLASGRRAPHLPARGRRMGTLSDAGLLAAVRDMGGTAPEVLADPELVELFLPTLRADLLLSETFQAPADRRLRCPVVAMVGEQDSAISAEEFAGWQESTTGPFRSRTFPGGHFYLSPDVLAAIREDVLGFAGA